MGKATDIILVAVLVLQVIGCCLAWGGGKCNDWTFKNNYYVTYTVDY